MWLTSGTGTKVLRCHVSSFKVTMTFQSVLCVTITPQVDLGLPLAE